MQFSEWLRNQLIERNWTQADLAEASGVSPAQITRIITAQRGIGLDAAKSIARALRLPPETVYRAAGLLPQKPMEDEKQDILDHLFASLPPEGQEEVLEFLQFKVDQYESNKKRLKPRLST